MNSFFIPIVVGIVFFDQIIKYIVVHNMHLGQSITLIPGVCNLTYILNAGAAFGIMKDNQIFFIVIAILLIASVIYYRKKIRGLSAFYQLGISFLVGGAIGNMVDRVSSGKVVDYMDFIIWPIFNLADIFIVLGCIIILIKTIFSKE